MGNEEKRTELFKRQISRRDLLKASALLGGGLLGANLLAACGGGGGETTPTESPVVSGTETPAKLKDTELNIWTWGIYAPEFAVRSFEERYGVRVNVTFYHGNEELWSKLQAGHGGVDIIQPSHHYVQRMQRAGLIAELDESRVPNFEGVYEQFRTAEYSMTAGKRYSFPFVFGITGIVYNRDHISTAPDSWSVMWDPQYDGKIAMESNEEWVYAAALYEGIDISTLDQDTDAKLERIKAKMREQKPLLLKNWESLEEIKNLLASGDVWLAHTDDGLGWGMQIDGLPMATAVPKEGAVAWADQFCILSDAPHKDAAYAWINHMFEPQNAAELASQVGYMTVNQKSLDYLEPKLKAIMTHTDEELSRVIWMPYYDPPMMDKIIRAYEDVRAS